MFEKEDVKRLVESACHALETENDYLKRCFETHGWQSWGGRPKDIRDNINERYYQFVIWRELMSSFPWRPRTEPEGYDLVFYDDETTEPVTYAEIKGWWSESGKLELQRIRRDLTDKLGVLKVSGVMLILTSHQREKTEENIRWLAEQLEVSRNDMVTAFFPVSPWPGQEGAAEFGVIGFLVKPQALPLLV